MELLSQSAIDALQVCANEEVVKDDQFATLVENSVSYVLDSAAGDNDNPSCHIQGMTSALSKQSHPSLMVLFLEAAKTDIGPEQMNMVLDDCGFSAQRKEVILEAYKLNKQKIRAKLSLISRGYPHVVDVDWKLDYNLKNSQLNKVMELKYTLALKTEHQNAEEKDNEVLFSCTRDQLQDFVGKLKQAVKAVERASQN